MRSRCCISVDNWSIAQLFTANLHQYIDIIFKKNYLQKFICLLLFDENHGYNFQYLNKSLKNCIYK